MEEGVQRFCSCGSGKPEDSIEGVSSRGGEREEREGSQREKGEPKV